MSGKNRSGCVEPGCILPHRALGYCARHVHRSSWYKDYYARNKDRIAERRKNRSPEERERISARRRALYARRPEKYNDRCRRYSRTVPGRYAQLKTHARAKSRDLEITLEQYTHLAGMPCHYCRYPLPPTGHGLDRRDSSLGYRLDNVVPCCVVCNTAKSDKFSYAEFRDIMQQKLAVSCGEDPWKKHRN